MRDGTNEQQTCLKERRCQLSNKTLTLCVLDLRIAKKSNDFVGTAIYQ